MSDRDAKWDSAMEIMDHTLFNALKMEQELADQQTGESTDAPRLSKQLTIVKDCLDNGEWWTLAALAAHANASTQSVSARIRDLRKERFGSHDVQRQRVAGGLYEYRLVKPGSC